MLRNRDDDVEVSGRTAGQAGFSFTTQFEAGPVVDTRRNFEVQVLRDAHTPAAAARLAWIRDDRAFTPALRAGLGNREKPLLKAHLPASPARWASAGGRAALRTTAPARLAALPAGNRDLPFATERGLLEQNLEVVAQVLAPARAASRAAAATAKEIAEDVTEKIL